MKLRGKPGLWLIIVLGIILVLFVMPAASEQSWLESIKNWVSDYNEAADEAGQGADDDEAGDDNGNLQSMTVILDDEAVGYAGVETMPVSEKLLFPEIKAYASVMDSRDLIQWRSRINQALSAVNIAQVTERSALQELQRLKKLAQNGGSVASKNITYAEADWQKAGANLQAARFQLEDAKAELIQHWGDTIGQWVLDKNSKEFERLVSRQDTLILVTLPVDETLPADISVIRVSGEGNRDSARKSHFVSPAYIATQQIQGETYFFRITTGKLRTGMRLDAWIPQNGEPLQGVHIPEQAVVWYAGQPWVYVELEKGSYKRRPLTGGQSVAGGLFVQSGFKPGEKLVIAGSQMLLSEEFRWQIHDEDDD
jgi:hypothetical protein